MLVSTTVPAGKPTTTTTAPQQARTIFTPRLALFVPRSAKRSSFLDFAATHDAYLFKGVVFFIMQPATFVNVDTERLRRQVFLSVIIVVSSGST